MKIRHTILVALVAVGLLALTLAISIAGLRPRGTVKLPSDRYITCLAYSPDGNHLVVGTRSGEKQDRTFWEGEIAVWEIATLKKLHTIKTEQWVRELALSSKGDLLVVGIGCFPDALDIVNMGFAGRAGEAKLFSFPVMKELGKVESGLCVNSVAFSPDGKKLATLGLFYGPKNVARPVAHPELKIWDVATHKLLHDIPTSGSFGKRIRVEPDGKRFALTERVPDGEGRKPLYRPVVRQYEWETAKPVATISLPRTDPLNDFLYVPKSSKMVLNQGTLNYGDTNAGSFNETAFFEVLGHRPFLLAASADGKWLVAANDLVWGSPVTPGKIHLWDIEAGKLIDQWEMPSQRTGVFAVAISPDKRTVAVGYDQVYLFDVKAK